MKNPFESRTSPRWRMELLSPKRSWAAFLTLAMGFTMVCAVTTHYLYHLNQLTKAKDHFASFTFHPDESLGDVPDKETQAAKVVIQRLALPWDSLFRALETASIAGVHLHSVVPDSSRGVVSLTGEAPDIYQVFEYWRALKSQSTLKDVVLTDYGMDDAQNENAVNFTITASWRFEHDL